MKFGQFDIDTCSFFSYANFPSCPNNDFHRTFAFYPGYSLGSCIVFSCHNVFALFSWRQFLSLSLSFMTLIFFKSTGHLFYRMFFNFEWSGFFFFSWLDSGYAFLVGIFHEYHYVFLMHHVRRHIMFLSAIIGTLNFNNLIEMVPVMISIIKVLFSLLKLIGFVGKTLRLCQLTVPSQYFYLIILTFIVP